MEINILTYVLDDNDDLLTLIDQLLRKNNITEYRLFNNAGDFFKEFHDKVHICIIDYYLPGVMTGLEVMQEVLKRNPRCYVIVMTAQDDINVVIKCLNKGARKYVDKRRDNYLHILIGYLQKAINEIRDDIEFYFEMAKSYNEITRKHSTHESNRGDF